MKKLSSLTRMINILIFSSIALLLCAAALPTSIGNLSNGMKMTAVSGNAPAKLKAPTHNLKSKKIERQQLPSSLADLVDPTRPPDAMISPNKSFLTASPLSLNAIFYYPDNQAAIINGDFVRAGDSVGEYTIINIHRDTVELIGIEGKELTLRMFPQIKQYRNKEG